MQLTAVAVKMKISRMKTDQTVRMAVMNRCAVTILPTSAKCNLKGCFVTVQQFKFTKLFNHIACIVSVGLIVKLIFIKKNFNIVSILHYCYNLNRNIDTMYLQRTSCNFITCEATENTIYIRGNRVIKFYNVPVQEHGAAR